MVKDSSPRKGQTGSGRSPKKRGTDKNNDKNLDNAAPIYVSQSDLQRHIHESLKPLQRMADQANLPFLGYLIAMAVEESKHEPDKPKVGKS